jgi:hypothetical protein
MWLVAGLTLLSGVVVAVRMREGARPTFPRSGDQSAKVPAE